MEKNKKRAQRRKAEAKKLRKAMKIADNIFRFNGSSDRQNEEWKAQWARKYANNLKACSCWMCCSPRENGQLTMQERRVNQRERYCNEVD